MNKKIIISVLLIIMVLALSIGATYAWFTASLQLPTNKFKTGTVEIDGSDFWASHKVGDTWHNVNPGDCKDKTITIKNKGTKNVLLRFRWEGKWVDMEDGVNSLVKLTEYVGWTLHEDEHGNVWYYYNGKLAPNGTLLQFATKFCLDGEETGNEYQGKYYYIDLYFEACQASNNASESLWGVKSKYHDENDKSAANWSGFDFGE